MSVVSLVSVEYVFVKTDRESIHVCRLCALVLILVGTINQLVTVFEAN